MIITVTPNPTIDRVYYIPELKPNWVHRAQREVATPSGKGVDVSIILHLLGESTIALGFNAGYTGRMLTAMLDMHGLRHDLIDVIGETRTVPVLVDQTTNAEYTITAPTLSATDQHVDQLISRLETYGAGAWGVVCAGSLCTGMPDDSYARLLRSARHLGLCTLLDASGTALRSGLAGQPHIIKINLTELAALHPAFLPDAQAGCTDVADIAKRLMPYLGELATDAIIISMGRLGALAVTRSGNAFAHALNVPVKVSNGAGDAMDAGIMLARKRGQSWVDALRLGTAAAGAAIMHNGTSGCDPTQVWKLLPQVDVDLLV